MKLASFGLKSETASFHFDESGVLHVGIPVGDDIPAWDLNTLVQILPSPRFVLNTDIEYYLDIDGTTVSYMYDESDSGDYKFYKVFNTYDNIWDNMIDCYRWAIDMKWIKKKYLNSNKKKHGKEQ